MPWHKSFWRRLPLLPLTLSQFGLRPSYREGTQPHPLAENWIKDLLSMAMPPNQDPVWKGRKTGHWKVNLPGQLVSNMTLEIVEKLLQKEWRGWAKVETTPSCGMSGGERKVWCCKEQYCIGTRMLGPWIKVNWKWLNRRWQEWTLTL